MTHSSRVKVVFFKRMRDFGIEKSFRVLCRFYGAAFVLLLIAGRIYCSSFSSLRQILTSLYILCSLFSPVREQVRLPTNLNQFFIEKSPFLRLFSLGSR